MRAGGSDGLPWADRAAAATKANRAGDGQRNDWTQAMSLAAQAPRLPPCLAARTQVEASLASPDVMDAMALSFAYLGGGRGVAHMQRLRDTVPVLGMAGTPPEASCAEPPLTQHEIEAAPSVPADKLDLFRAWRIENEPVEAGDSKPGRALRGARARLAAALGNPSPRGWLAIAAKAVAEGKLPAGDLPKAARTSTAEAVGLKPADLDLVQKLAAGLSLSQAAAELGKDVGNASRFAQRIAGLFGIEGSLAKPENRSRLQEEAVRLGLADPPPAPEPELPPFQRLTARQVETLRRWIVAGAPATEVADEQGQAAYTVRTQRRDLSALLGISRPSDWVPVLRHLLNTGQLSPSEVAQATANLLEQPHAGPKAPWSGLLKEVAQQGGATKDDIREREWQARASKLGLSGTEQQALKHAALGFSNAETCDLLGLSQASTSRLRSSLGQALGVPAGIQGQALTYQIIAAALDKRALPKAYDPQVVGVARTYAAAVALGLPVTPTQAGILFDLRSGVPLEEVKARHREGWDTQMPALRAALGVSAQRNEAANAQAMVDAARALGLGEPLPGPAAQLNELNRLRDDHLDTIRSWLVDGLTAEAVGQAEYMSRPGIASRRNDLQLLLGIQSPADWVPVLLPLLREGRLTPGEVLKASATLLSGQGGGPEEAWAPLFDQLLQRGAATPGEIEGLNWQVRASDAGLTPSERTMLKLAAAGRNSFQIMDEMVCSYKNVTLLSQGLASKLGVEHDDQSHGQVKRILAAAAEKGLAPLGCDPRTMEAAQTYARSNMLGLGLTTVQCDLLRDLNAGEPLAKLMRPHGDGFGKHIRSLRAALGVDEPWEGGRNAQALVDAARQAGLVDPVPWPDPATAPGAFRALLEERFGMGPLQHALVQALSALPPQLGPEAKLARAARTAGVSVETAQAMVVNMSQRLRVADRTPSVVRIAEAIRAWLSASNFGDLAHPEERDRLGSLTTPRLLTSQLDLMQQIQSLADLNDLSSTTGRNRPNLQRALETLERRLDIPRAFDEAPQYVEAVIAAARSYGLAPQPPREDG